MYHFFDFDEEDLHPPFRVELTKLFTKKVGRYSPSITFLTLNQKKKFEEYCTSSTIHKAYKLNVNYKFLKARNKFPFLIYLSKTKGEENLKAINDRKKVYTIVFSSSHFNKVCRKTIGNNYKFQIVLDDIRLYNYEPPPKNYSIFLPNFNWSNKTKKQDDKIVSIGGKEDLKKPIEVMPQNLLPPSPPQSPPPPKLKKIKTTSTPKPKNNKSSVLDNTTKKKSGILDKIISDTSSKKKLEKSLILIKSII